MAKKPLTTFMKRMMSTHETINWEKVPTGTKFTAKISGENCSGLIYNDPRHKRIYFCQNTRAGNESPNLLGYRYSWVRNYYETDRNNSSSNIILSPKNKNFKCPELLEIGDHIVKFCKGKITFGNTEINNKIVRKLFKQLKD